MMRIWITIFFIASTYASTIFHFQNEQLEVDEQSCEIGELFWKEDGFCYPAYERGPCPFLHNLVPSPNGPVCRKRSFGKEAGQKPPPPSKISFGDGFEVEEKGETETTTTTSETTTATDATTTEMEGDETTTEYPLSNDFPNGDDEEVAGGVDRQKIIFFDVEDGFNSWNVTEEEEECLSKDMVLWEPDGGCYELLNRGPCQSGEWLVLDVIDGRPKCERPMCQCEVAADCEVFWAADGRCHNRNDHNVCGENEQLFITPRGDGACDCRTAPVFHVSHAGSCEPLYRRGGRCAEEEHLAYDDETGKFACKTNPCYGIGDVLLEDGLCYRLGETGPCKNGRYLQVNVETLAPVCESPLDDKRIFDLVQSSNGSSFTNKVKLGSCRVDHLGICRQVFSRRSNSTRLRSKLMLSRARKASSYMRWLRSFKKKY